MCRRDPSSYRSGARRVSTSLCVQRLFIRARPVYLRRTAERDRFRSAEPVTENDVGDASEDAPERLIREARTGDEALGRLLARYSNYLSILARVELGRRLQGKLDPADLVQQTMLRTNSAFSELRSHDSEVLMAWLRRILARTLADAEW